MAKQVEIWYLVLREQQFQIDRCDAILNLQIACRALMCLCSHCQWFWSVKHDIIFEYDNNVMMAYDKRSTSDFRHIMASLLLKTYNQALSAFQSINPSACLHNLSLN